MISLSPSLSQNQMITVAAITFNWIVYLKHQLGLAYKRIFAVDSYEILGLNCSSEGLQSVSKINYVVGLDRF